MSYEELDRVGVIERVIEKRLTQREAARMLGLTSRQVRRLQRAYVRDGPRALASKHRGRPSNRRLSSALRREALATVRSRYEGFGPTLAHEKLTELHDLRLSVETRRHWMIEDLWVVKMRRLLDLAVRAAGSVPSRRFLPYVAMMKATDTRQSDHLRVRRRTSSNGAPLRCIANHSVNTLRIVVVDIVAADSAQVALIQYDHVIGGFSLA